MKTAAGRDDQWGKSKCQKWNRSVFCWGLLGFIKKNTGYYELSSKPFSCANVSCLSTKFYLQKYENKILWVGLQGPAAAAAAKLLQSCPTLCDPIDGSPPGSAIPGILLARVCIPVADSFLCLAKLIQCFRFKNKIK